jgi:hypothetical protein
VTLFSNIVDQIDLEKTHLETKLTLHVTFNDQINYQKKSSRIILSNKKNLCGFCNFDRFRDYTNNASETSLAMSYVNNIMD